MRNDFYVYVWYDNEVPVYVGKGCKNRAFRTDEYTVKIVSDNLSEEDAFKTEKFLIEKYGRADKGAGSLMNLTDGGGIPWHSLYWKNDKLQDKFRQGIERRSQNKEWKKAQAERARHAASTRSPGWQDSKYIVTTPSGEVFELKTQEMKQFALDRGLSFNHLKHIARKGRAGCRGKHAGYLVEMAE